MSADELAPIVRLAPAKVNLTLSVVERRGDGFHALHSVMVPLGLADRLSLARAAASTDSLHVVGGEDGRTTLDPADFGSVLAGIEAARRVVGRGADAFPIAARLEKRIPIAAGLAGGSSDAAAAIDGALDAWGVEMTAGDRARIGATVLLCRRSCPRGRAGRARVAAPTVRRQRSRHRARHARCRGRHRRGVPGPRLGSRGGTG
jgi:4-diphosphocytidyl-2-C-methyl-D-erythritol kinase